MRSIMFSTPSCSYVSIYPLLSWLTYSVGLKGVLMLPALPNLEKLIIANTPAVETKDSTSCSCPMRSVAVVSWLSIARRSHCHDGHFRRMTRRFLSLQSRADFIVLVSSELNRPFPAA